MLPIVCITGCSSGIGMETALLCAQSCQVIATVRSEKGKSELLNRAIKAGITLDIQRCDVTHTADVQALHDYIKQEYKRLDCLINNAGVALGGFFEDCSADQIEKVMNTNVLGLMSVSRAMIPLLRKGERPKLINMSSIAGMVGAPTISVYNASKYAVEGFSEALLFELKPFNIDVVLIQPGQYKTRIFTENLAIGQNSENPKSVYRNYTELAFGKLKRKLQTVLKDPYDVAKLCVSIIHKKRPRFRYLIGNDARFRLYLKRVLPFEIYRVLVNNVCSRLLFKHTYSRSS